jgi:hypothetical protein
MKNISDWREWDWNYASQDPVAMAELKKRLMLTGSRYALISYTDLVKGIVFEMPNVHNGEPFEITPDSWCGLYRKIIGNMLGWLSLESYHTNGYWSSALVIGRSNSQPSDIFFQWMVNLEVIDGKDDMHVLPFWTEQVHRAHKYCRKEMKNAEA